jgi:translocation and assembly module TamB
LSPKRKKILTISAATLACLAVLLAVTSLLVIQSEWFSNFVREKIISVAQESTGGRVEIGSFEFDWRRLTVRIRNFILHGTEPPSGKPLLSASLVELRLSLLAGLKQAVDLQYLGIQKPEVNLIVFPDGKTNVPGPKSPQKPGDKSGLQTVVDLAVHEFQIRDGLLAVSQQKTPFSARGENLRVLLNYNLIKPSYQGSVVIDPLLLTSANQAPLLVHVSLPLSIERDAITLRNARLTTAA